MMKTNSDRCRLLKAVCVVVGAAAGLMSATAAAAQSGPEIIQQVLDAQRDRLSGIESLLIEQELMGMATTLYLVKETVDGEPTLVVQTTTIAGMNVPLPQIVLDAWSGSAAVYGRWVERFKLDGTDTIEGQPVYRLTIDDFSGIDFGAPSPDDFPGRPLAGVFYVEQESLVVRRMELDMEIEAPGTGETEVTKLVSTLYDYREVEGYLHPFRTSVSWDGLIRLMSDGRGVAEMERELAELEQRLSEVPPAQREMIEQMLEPMRNMLSGAPMETIVTRLEANVDPPARGR